MGAAVFREEAVDSREGAAVADIDSGSVKFTAGFIVADGAIRQYGRGPIENWPDRKDAAYVGRYTSTVTDMEEFYISLI